jgi:hypothetical protein
MDTLMIIICIALGVVINILRTLIKGLLSNIFKKLETRQMRRKENAALKAL